MSKLSDWKLVPHFHQIADTGDYTGCYEITNGKMSIFTDDYDDGLEEVVKALNDSGAKFYLDDSYRFEIEALKGEISDLKSEMRDMVKEIYKYQ